MEEMSSRVVAKNEVTFSSAISACEKCGQWRPALDLLTQMVRSFCMFSFDTQLLLAMVVPEKVVSHHLMFAFNFSTMI